MSFGPDEYLHDKTVADLITDNMEVATLTKDDSIEAFLKLLGEKHISSVPILDGTAIVGMADTLDLVSYMVSTAPATVDEAHLEQFSRVIALNPVSAVVDHSGRDPTIPINVADKVTMALGFFAMGIHRVPIVDDSEAIVNILSQSSVARHLKDEIVKGDMGVMSAKTLADFSLDQCDIASIEEDATVIEALTKLRDEGVAALAVLHPDGKLAGNLSAGDLRGLSDDKLPNLLATVGDFMDNHNPNSRNVVCVEATTTLAAAIGEFADNGVHRLWVLDSEMMPCGVLSLTDVMRLFNTYDASA